MRYFIFLLFFIGCGSDLRVNKSANKPPLNINLYDLEKSDRGYFKVVDGDTLKVKFQDKITTIRLIGIDSFEMHKNNKAYRQAYENNITIQEVIRRGKMARDFLKRELQRHKDYYFEYDEELLDRYHRTLAYIWFSESDMLNMDIVCKGYALSLTIKPDTRYSKRFQECEKEAKKEKIGVWRR